MKWYTTERCKQEMQEPELSLMLEKRDFDKPFMLHVN